MKKKRGVADVISELSELAEQVKLPDGALDGEVEEECSYEARCKARSINSGTMMEQLEYLYGQGFQVEQLKQMIRDYGESS